MRIPPKLKSTYRRLGWVDRLFIVLATVYMVLSKAAPASGWTILFQMMAVIFGFIAAVRLIRRAGKRAIWRLRNRLIVTYLFIAVVPVVLILTLAGLVLFAVTSQVAVYLATSELDRRIQMLQGANDMIAQAPPAARSEVMKRMAELAYKDRFPGIEMALRTPSGLVHYPPDSDLDAPPSDWGPNTGIVLKDGSFYAWSHGKLPDGDFTVIAPLSREYLMNMVPNLGIVHFVMLRASTTKGKAGIRIGDRDLEIQRDSSSDVFEEMPPKANQLDVEVRWSALLPIAVWEKPGAETNVFLLVRSRPSAVYAALFSRKSEDIIQGFVPIALLAVSITFLIVELFALVIGITMTRTITNAVHHLYEGTRRVMHGDFSHRIEVRGAHQLADLSHSFNQMTSRIEELLVVAKEKERLQSELEIAREVQNQLYPKRVPEVRTLRLTAVCKPARMVSGDYFDYECMADSRVALAIGDVAGKGISAALLMATLQSSLRTELRGNVDLAVLPNGARPLSTSNLVSHLNRQLYEYTSPEKYATFYLGIYDEAASVLSYTNAGHLPPILVREGVATRLNVDGTVVGAFPFAQYDESQIVLQTGDLLVCFTDGVSEPENEYGEMFGEERLLEIITKNAHRSEDQIVATVIQAVEEWTGSPELQDDMTLLLARRV